jgi:glycosyltransferase involved in cell wall biosynthesis
MSRIAFYAPLKSPDHPKPSGDRTMAQGISSALADMPHKPKVDLVSRLQTRDPQGNHENQQRLIDLANAEISELLAKPRNWDTWVTYHNYYKAPDLIGPTVARALNIPYVLIEASRAAKRLVGPWADFATRAESACDTADVIFYLTERDRPALAMKQPAGQNLIHLKPFLNQTVLPDTANCADDVLLAVGMFRHGDKLNSYMVLAQALHHCQRPWKLRIIGDGPARAVIQKMFAPFGERVKFIGQMTNDQVATEMSRARGFVWPGVNEAFGMVYLEAQAHGLPVVAQNRPGVRDVIGPTGYMSPPDDIVAYAAAIDTMLCDPLAIPETRHYISQNHLRPAATALFADVLPGQKERK